MINVGLSPGGRLVRIFGLAIILDIGSLIELEVVRKIRTEFT